MADFLTRADVDAYGSDLVDFAQRAAIHAVGPHLENLTAENAELQRRLAREAKHRLDQQVERAVPNYQEIDRDPGWHRWLLGYDALSGEIRQRLLNAAIQRGDSSAVIAFFRSYQREGGSAHASPGSGGRARPSSTRGRVYTRDEVKTLYRQHQLGVYKGQEAAWAQLEADIIRASGEGRITGGVDVQGK